MSHERDKYCTESRDVPHNPAREVERVGPTSGFNTTTFTKTSTVRQTRSFTMSTTPLVKNRQLFIDGAWVAPSGRETIEVQLKA